MKERELRQYARCSNCQKLIGESGLPLFWRVTVEQFGVKMQTIRRQDAFVQFIGSTLIGQAMGPDEEMTQTMTEKKTLCICATCAMEYGAFIHRLAECRDVISG